MRLNTKPLGIMPSGQFIINQIISGLPIFFALWSRILPTLCVMLFQRGNLDMWSAYFGPFFPFTLACVVVIAEFFIAAMQENK